MTKKPFEFVKMLRSPASVRPTDEKKLHDANVPRSDAERRKWEEEDRRYEEALNV